MALPEEVSENKAALVEHFQGAIPLVDTHS